MAENDPHKPISFWRFWWITIKEAWSESREKFGLLVDILLFVAAILLFVFAWYSKHHPKFNAGEENEAVSYWFAIIPAGLWVLWFLYHVPKAAHKVYLEQHEHKSQEALKLLEKLTDVESKLEQFYHQTKPLAVSYAIKEMPNQIQSFCEIILTNDNPTQSLDSVVLSLINITPALWRADSTIDFNIFTFLPRLINWTYHPRSGFK